MGYITETSSQVSWMESETALRMWRAGEKESLLSSEERRLSF